MDAYSNKELLARPAIFRKFSGVFGCTSSRIPANSRRAPAPRRQDHTISLSLSERGGQFVLSTLNRTAADKMNHGRRHKDHPTNFAGRCRGGNNVRSGPRGVFDRELAGASDAVDFDLCRRWLQRHFVAYPGGVFRGADGPEILRRKQAGCGFDDCQPGGGAGRPGRIYLPVCGSALRDGRSHVRQAQL
jgi:hypothetical protein